MFAALLGVVYGVTHTLTPDGQGPLPLQWLLAVALGAAGVAAVQAVRFLVLDVAFLRMQGHTAPALIHAVVALAMYFTLGLLIAGLSGVGIRSAGAPSPPA